jgi:hypothetical protein
MLVDERPHYCVSDVERIDEVARYVVVRRVAILATGS